MTDLFDDFLETGDPFNQNQESNGSFDIVANAIVQPAYSGWADNVRKEFTYVHNESGSETTAKQECWDFINEAVAASDYPSFPQKGLLTTIKGDDVPSHPNGFFEDGDRLNFVQSFHNDKEMKTRLVQEEWDLVSDTMPFDAVLEGLSDNKNVLYNYCWCKISQVEDQYRKAKSKPNWKIYVIDKSYNSRDEALVDNNIQSGDVPNV